jgi:sterol desaturase/sphingolipid hydroxylase (fatty acid hydroxylase superfamily)
MGGIQMSHIEIDRSDIPIRLFKSDFMEFFTHIHPAVIVVIWGPVVIYFLWSGFLVRPGGLSAWYIPMCYLAGLFFWTFAEYTLHRFVFHFKPRNPTQERIIFLFHGVHHAQPQCKTRLVMPPVVTIPMVIIFYGLFSLILGTLFKAQFLVNPVAAGTLTGYIIYDLTHYATHHFTMRKGYLKFLRKYHMQHHYKTPDARFGVSSPLWDMVFGTKPE